MKNFIYTFCVCSLVLAILFSCLDHRENPGTAGSCQIVQETIKTRTSISGIQSPDGLPVEETILLDETNAGSPLPGLLPIKNTLTLATTGAYTYRYDSQGRLIEETSTSVDNPPNNPTTTIYEYTASTLKITRLGFRDANGNPQTDNYTLNDRGLIATSNLNGGQQTYTYDATGYLAQIISVSSTGDTIRRQYTIENGNVIKVVNSGLDFIQTITYAYDLTKLNLPYTRTIPTGQSFADSEGEAKQSRNLPIKRVDEINGSKQTESGPQKYILLNVEYYTYTFDAQNRVKRKLHVETYSSSFFGSPLSPALLNAFTTDYTYRCPSETTR